MTFEIEIGGRSRSVTRKTATASSKQGSPLIGSRRAAVPMTGGPTDGIGASSASTPG